MPIDTFIAYAGVYGNVDDAVADYEFIKDLHTEAGLIDAFDAAVIERKRNGKTKIVKKHETPTRAGGVLGAGCRARDAASWSRCSRSRRSAAGCCVGHGGGRRRRSERSPATPRPA